MREALFYKTASMGVCFLSQAKIRRNLVMDAIEKNGRKER